MRALLLDSDGTLALREHSKPARAGECVIRVTAAGICGTDLELLRGYAGFTGIPGHEFVGVVESAPDADAAWIGRRVVGEITVGCGECAGCRTAGRGHCDVRSVIGIRGRDGAFAEYLCLPSRNLHRVPDALDDVTAVFVEPAAAACRVIEQLSALSGARAAVVGAGRLGLLVAQVLREHGANVTVIARGESGRAIAATLDFAVVPVDTAASMLARRFDVVVDATGRPQGFAAARALVRARGTIVLKSTFHGETPIALASLVVDEIAVIGSRCGPFERAIELLAAGEIRVKPFVAGCYPLERFAEAFENARRGGAKILLLPSNAADNLIPCG